MFHSRPLLFAPLGFGGATVKVCPPLTITEEAVKDGVEVLDQAIRMAGMTLQTVH